MATVHCWFDWYWAGAEREFRRAIELKPNYAAAHNWYAAYLNAMLRFDEAAAEQRIAEELDPLSLMIAVAAADPYYFSRQYPSAIQCLQQVLRRQPEFPSAHFNLGKAYLQSGMHQEAITAFEAAVRLSGVRQAELAWHVPMPGQAMRRRHTRSRRIWRSLAGRIICHHRIWHCSILDLGTAEKR